MRCFFFRKFSLFFSPKLIELFRKIGTNRKRTNKKRIKRRRIEWERKRWKKIENIIEKFLNSPFFEWYYEEIKKLQFFFLQTYIFTEREKCLNALIELNWIDIFDYMFTSHIFIVQVIFYQFLLSIEYQNERISIFFRLLFKLLKNTVFMNVNFGYIIFSFQIIQKKKNFWRLFINNEKYIN